MSKKIIVKCPICKVLVEKDNNSFPFCSERCKITDLGNWASDSYSISDKSELDDDSQVFH